MRARVRRRRLYCLALSRFALYAPCKIHTQVVECRVQYDGDGSDIAAAACQLGTLNSTTCTINITTTRDMKAPIFLYYELNNFYQNHRRYVKSRSDPQLAGTMFTDAGALSDCDPLRDIVTNGTTRVLDPCGLIANSYFNDTFHLTAASSTTLPFVDETGISWASDRRKFVPPPSNAWSMYPNVVFINETYPDVSVSKVSSTITSQFAYQSPRVFLLLFPTLIFAPCRTFQTSTSLCGCGRQLSPISGNFTAALHPIFPPPRHCHSAWLPTTRCRRLMAKRRSFCPQPALWGGRTHSWATRT